MKLKELTRIESVRPGALAVAGGEEVRADVVVWAAGFAVPDLARRSGLATDGRGRVLVDAALRSVSHPDVFATERAIYRRLGRIMPLYMVSTLASFLPVLAMQRRPATPAFRFTLAGLLRFAAMAAVTRNGNLPINARIEELTAEEASLEEFGELRRRWDRLHAVRNVLNVGGLVFACLGALSEPRPRKVP